MFAREENKMELQYTKLDQDFPARIVCLSYDVFNILYELGCAENIIGKPSGAEGDKISIEHVQNIGGFARPDFNAIVALNPDIVIGYSEISAKIMARLIMHEVNVLVLQHASLEEIYRSIGLLGKICSKTLEATALTNTMREGFQKISASRPNQYHRPVVYFEEWNDPYVSGIKWVSDIITIAGGTDGFTHRCRSPKAMERIITTEEVVTAAPDIILASWCGKPVDIDSIRRRPGWELIPAISQGHIYEVPGEIILQPGPALIEGARYLNNIINQHTETEKVLSF
ncbi:MAG: cobalamin-binding protein [Dehalococcoidales bacterium]|nr:cobalamin-binding protein [Dehalococcoidales bacterium]MDP6577365.1 ABC transporter substrate-binding protein [Dehalococcoidales bacterium]